MAGAIGRSPEALKPRYENLATRTKTPFVELTAKAAEQVAGEVPLQVRCTAHGRPRTLHVRSFLTPRRDRRARHVTVTAVRLQEQRGFSHRLSRVLSARTQVRATATSTRGL